MASLFSLFEHYMKTGGITMYPLVFCCLWMWGKILYNLPVWQPPPGREIERIQRAFLRFRTGCRRYDKTLLATLQGQVLEHTVQKIATIKTLAALAPFLGLFGTVTGMIKTFESVARFGLANPKALAGGISEAMVTTQFGLLIAVPGILAVFFLKQKALGRQGRIERGTGHLLSYGEVNHAAA